MHPEEAIEGQCAFRSAPCHTRDVQRWLNREQDKTRASSSPGTMRTALGRKIVFEQDFEEKIDMTIDQC